jgi:ribosome-associated protein
VSEESPSESGIELAPGVRVPASGLRVQFSRSAGPGGQNVNKVNTKAQLWLALSAVAGLSPGASRRLMASAGRKMTQAGELHLTCETQRTAEGNRQALFERLREIIVNALVEPKRRRKTRPTRASKKRRLEAKRRRSNLKSTRRAHADG